ncbi:MAG: hypothetical protein LQ339_008040 [Xanthoria mediterranea]|nr:MAG: hypothetical protein LQ339_008040 [Xanthoria mediterranea]
MLLFSRSTPASYLDLDFSTLSSQSFLTPHRTRRNREQDPLNQFGALVVKGSKYFDEGAVYAAKGFGDPPPSYGPKPFEDNGQTISEAEDPLPAVFNRIPPRGPEPDDYMFVKRTQHRAFIYAWHEIHEPIEHYEGKALFATRVGLAVKLLLVRNHGEEEIFKLGCFVKGKMKKKKKKEKEKRQKKKPCIVLPFSCLADAVSISSMSSG